MLLTPTWELDLPIPIDLWFLLVQWVLIILSQFRLKLKPLTPELPQAEQDLQKAAGNYAAALYPAKLAQNEGYKQLIWTDAKEHKYIEEAGTMNVMFVMDGKLITPLASDTILDGITRRSVVEIAQDWGMEVESRKIEVAEVINALKNNTLTEAFGAGTAATVTPISSIALEMIIIRYQLQTQTIFT